jgi:hypothetical protein
LLVEWNLILFTAGLVPDLVLYFLKLLNVMRTVHRMMLLEIVECRATSIIFGAGPRDYFWRLESNPLFSLFSIHANHIFEGFDFVWLWQL